MKGFFQVGFILSHFSLGEKVGKARKPQPASGSAIQTLILKMTRKQGWELWG